MSELIAGNYLAFSGSGEGDQIAGAPVLVEVTDFDKDGDIELAFNASQLRGSPQIYLRVSLPNVLAVLMNMHGRSK